MRPILTLAALLIFLPQSGRADEAADSLQIVDTSAVADDERIPDTAGLAGAEIISDSSLVKDTVLFIPTDEKLIGLPVDNPYDLESNLSQKPTVALFKSMLIPGWGQFANRSYIKAGIFAGLETWFILSAVDHGKDARDLRNAYEAETDVTLRNTLYQEYQNSRSDRNQYTWFAGITIFVSMFDAYVDAHLSGAPDQPRNEKIELDVKPDNEGGASVSLSLRF